jgi:gas vesicle protein
MTHHMTHKTEAGSAAALAFIVGAAAGVTAGLLLAPKKGEETRTQIKDKVQQARNKAMDKMHEQREAAREKADEVTGAAQDAVEEGKDTARIATERTRRSATKLNDELK